MTSYKPSPLMQQAAQRARANQPPMKSVTSNVKSSWVHSVRAGEGK